MSISKRFFNQSDLTLPVVFDIPSMFSHSKGVTGSDKQFMARLSSFSDHYHLRAADINDSLNMIQHFHQSNMYGKMLGTYQMEKKIMLYLRHSQALPNVRSNSINFQAAFGNIDDKLLIYKTRVLPIAYKIGELERLESLSLCRTNFEAQDCRPSFHHVHTLSGICGSYNMASWREMYTHQAQLYMKLFSEAYKIKRAPGIRVVTERDKTPPRMELIIDLKKQDLWAQGLALVKVGITGYKDLISTGDDNSLHLMPGMR